MLRSLECFRDHHGHRLAVPMYFGILHDGQIAQRKALADVVEVHNRRRFDTRHVLVRDHGEHPRRLLRCGGVDLADFPFCDGAVNERCIGQVVEFEFGRKTRLASHLRMTIDALH